MIRKNVYKKRRDDLAADADAGFDTTPEEDARLRQQSPSNFFGENGGGFFHQSEPPGPSEEERAAAEEEEFSKTPPWEAWQWSQDRNKMFRFLEYWKKRSAPKASQSPNAENRSQMSTGGSDDELLNNPEKYNRMNRF